MPKATPEQMLTAALVAAQMTDVELFSVTIRPGRDEVMVVPAEGHISPADGQRVLLAMDPSLVGTLLVDPDDVPAPRVGLERDLVATAHGWKCTVLVSGEDNR